MPSYLASASSDANNVAFSTESAHRSLPSLLRLLCHLKNLTSFCFFRKNLAMSLWQPEVAMTDVLDEQGQLHVTGDV